MRNSHGKIQSANVSAPDILPGDSLSASHGICYVYADVCTAEYETEGITHVEKMTIATTHVIILLLITDKFPLSRSKVAENLI